MPTLIEPKVAAAFGVAANPGVYAVLLGSGVSRSAGIPTGWGIVLDLVRQLAKLEEGDPEDDLAAWYEERFGEPPQYSAILTNLAPAPADRQALLRGYFEPTADERSEAIKVPTLAHRAIARLVAGGWVRVIVTTNFDKLMEAALEAEDVAPVVISSPDQAVGAIPLAHCRCMVIKVHGDYLDPRIKNSAEELATFEDPINALLERVFDEYGLIVCGWSGEYDVALRCALERVKSRRYTTYWCYRGQPSPQARALIARRRAQEIQIADANTFFSDLKDSVESIRDAGQRHPLETRAAVETLKRYLPLEEHHIRLQELVRDSTEQIVAQLTGEAFPADGEWSEVEYLARVRKIEALTERSLALIANGCHWGKPESDDVWLESVRRLANIDRPTFGSMVTAYLDLFRYPALMILYGAGVSAIAKGRYEFLKELLLVPCRWGDYLGPKVVVGSIVPEEIVRGDGAGVLPRPSTGRANRFSASAYLHRLLRPVFLSLIPADYEYTEAFDRFEYLANLVSEDVCGYCFVEGIFVRRNRYSDKWLPRVVAQEIEAEKDHWPPLRAGLFQGSLDRLWGVKARVDEAVNRRA